MVQKNFSRLCIQPTKLIDRNPVNLTNPNFHFAIDQEELDYSLPDISIQK